MIIYVHTTYLMPFQGDKVLWRFPLSGVDRMVGVVRVLGYLRLRQQGQGQGVCKPLALAQVSVANWHILLEKELCCQNYLTYLVCKNLRIYYVAWHIFLRYIIS